jgi:hypothetical protein
MANPNLYNTSTITGRTALSAVGTGATTLVSNPAASGKVLKVNSVIIANIDGTNAADITADVYRNSTAFRFASTVSVPADTSIILLSKDNSLYLQEGDDLRLTASASGDLVGTVSFEEIG